ncbi:MAG: hypothetical protein ACK47B_09135 [Armatimonadota bacterium]
MATELEAPPQRVDQDEVERAIRLLFPEDHVVELRCPKTPNGCVSGYYDDGDSLHYDACQWSGRAESVYVTLNPVREDLLARACNRAKGYSKHTTADKDILRRRWLLVDFDAVRPAGISSNDEEHEAALERARACRDWLHSLDWPAPIYADSGNGAHLLYRVDGPNDAATERALKSILEKLARQFDDERVTVDPTTFNASRISKLYGTLAAKGDHVPRLGRVHRIARILDAPDRFEVLRLEGGAP